MNVISSIFGGRNVPYTLHFHIITVQSGRYIISCSIFWLHGEHCYPERESRLLWEKKTRTIDQDMQVNCSQE